jgi:DNA polymerase bacteriophage-type
MKYLVPDFETVSQCDLKKCGAWRYAEDITTNVLTLRWTRSWDNHVGIWHPGDPYPQDFQDPDVIFIAHNTAFEKAMWRCHMMQVYGWPDIKNNRWDDTMARCANLVIPQDLDVAVRVLRLPALKDTEASAKIIGLSKADRHGNYPPVTPEIIELADEYCADDCRAQKGLRERVGTLSAAERQVWLLDQRINERGVRLDLDLIAKMQKIVSDASVPLLKEFGEITGLKDKKGVVKLASPKLKPWCHDRGVLIPNLQKDTLALWLKEPDDDDDGYDQLAGEDEDDAGITEMPSAVRRALHIKQLIGSASIKKLNTANLCVSGDGRARGLLQYHGAGPGLWAGRLLQPQNFPRGTITSYKGEEPEDFVERKYQALMTGDAGYVETIIGPAVETVVSSLRHIIIPSPGREFVVGDFAGIQARIALAAAGQHDKTKLMASGADAYIDLACDIHGLPKPDWSKGKEVFKPQVKAFKEQHAEKRQDGKAGILGLGFQMGAPKFHKRYCRGKSLEFAKGVVDTYRKDWAPEVPKLWSGLDKAACDTVHYRTPHEEYGVLFQLEDMWLTARLPSGRKLYYFNPQPIRKVMPWSSEEEPDVRRAWTYQAKKQGKWLTIDAFGGLLTENLASGLARDLLVTAMFKCEKNGLPIVLTVHDEIVSDAEPRPDNAQVLRQIMEDRPQWAIDMMIPVEAETWAADRYRK